MVCQFIFNVCYAARRFTALSAPAAAGPHTSYKETDLSSQFLSLPLGLATLLCLGAAAAQPARADVTINSISGVPASVAATGAFVPVLIDCGGVASAPTGTATVTDSSGKVVSQNSLYPYQNDANGNPVVFSYLMFPGNADPTANAQYTVTFTVAGQPSSVSQTLSVEQGFLLPIQIKSVTPSSRTLRATDRSVSVSAGLAFGGPNQGSYVRGEAILKDSVGAWLEIEPLSGPGGADSSGNPVVTTTLSNVPANSSTSSHNYTITVLVEDNTGAWTRDNTSVTQLPAGGGTSGSVATAMTLTDPTSKAGQTAHITARLRRTTDNTRVSGETIYFSLNGVPLGTGVTNTDGVASLSYQLPNTMALGIYSTTASFAGDSTYAAASRDGSLTVTR